MKKLGILLIIYILFTATEAISAPKGVAKVLKFRGDISFEVPSTGEKGKLKEDLWLPESAVVTSGAKSFAKIIFIDKSRLTVGPSSQVVIKKFDTKAAGVINLLKGKIRSQVTKNYMDMKDKGKSKLFITTKNAAMGVRGTDFQVNFDAVNHTTDLITYSGAVAFNRYSNGAPERQTRNFLESTVSSKNAVMVTKGTFSRVSEQEDRPTKAYKLKAVHTRKLKKNENLQDFDEGEKKREVIPPGVTSREMNNDGGDLAQTMTVLVDRPAVLEVNPDKPVSEPVPIPLPLPSEPINEPIASINVLIMPPPPPPPAEIPQPKPPELPSLGTVKILINLI